jgi:hypothetical protein
MYSAQSDLKKKVICRSWQPVFLRILNSLDSLGLTGSAVLIALALQVADLRADEDKGASFSVFSEGFA